MLNKLKYILMMIILAATLQVAGQDYVIDEVCVGAEREYRVQGENGSTYLWELTDASGIPITFNNPTGTSFTDGSIYGNEVSITWNNSGEYYLSTIQTSAAGCDTMQQGIVRVHEQPTVAIDHQQPICPGNLVYLNALANNTSSLLWTTDGDGTFDDINNRSSVYTPGANDNASGYVTLTLTAEGNGHGSTCTAAVDDIPITLIKEETLRDTVYTTICESDLPYYDWFTQTITQAGNYDEHLTSVDGCDSTLTLVLTVLPDNLQPSANADLNNETTMEEAITINVLGNDIDPEGQLDPTSLAILTQPQHGTLTINTNNEFVYIPEHGFHAVDEFYYSVCDSGTPCIVMCDTARVTINVVPPINYVYANDDAYTASCNTLIGNVLDNDEDPEGDNMIVNTTPLVPPTKGILTLFEDGNFRYEFDRGISGRDEFVYKICDDDEVWPVCDSATVYITIIADFDCDNVPDSIDIDDDNDGITDYAEGDLSRDTDNDGIPDSLDIDSDGDGIPDNIEAQAEDRHINPGGIDENENGLDDIYEDGSNVGIRPVDTDGDGTPDYRDTDSDNDNVPDYIEGFDSVAKGIEEVTPTGADDDGDGLDNAYDYFYGGYNENDLDNPFGVDTPLQDFDGDGTRDWRDTDDDDDSILTKFEDLNGNGIYYDDDIDFDGHPEYLDYESECAMFIPEAFSPNGDGIHDYFQVYCIDKFPNAKMMIFDRQGNMLFEKEHYGNMNYWEYFEDAWWNGETIQNHQNTQHKAIPGVYMYIMEKGNGDLERGFVMVSY